MQCSVNLDILDEAIRLHLEDYGRANQGRLRSFSSRDGHSMRLLPMNFYYNEDWPALDLGEVRLRWLGENLTEIRFIDSPLLNCTQDEVIEKWSYDVDDLSVSERNSVVEAALVRLRKMHWEVREFLVERLKEDQLLGEGRPMSPRSGLLFVDPARVDQLRKIRSDKFDLAKVIRICDELNSCFDAQCFLATGALVRALIDHVPPIFGASSFSEVANNLGGKSVKASLRHLEVTSRNIADAILHQQVRSREVLPSATQINFSNDLDVLLSEIVRKLS